MDSKRTSRASNKANRGHTLTAPPEQRPKRSRPVDDSDLDSATPDRAPEGAASGREREGAAPDATRTRDADQAVLDATLTRDGDHNDRRDRDRTDAVPDDAELPILDPDRYELLGVHGRGGIGRVLRVRDKHLGRTVALKELITPHGTAKERFMREAMITARLEHPGIVPVHEAGHWPDGTPFYTMKLVSGRTLKDRINECQGLEDRLSLLPNIIAVADAVAYAHDNAVIHRDLKPSNILIGAFGETVVIDWGLAKDLSCEHDNPAPEQEPYRTPSSPELTTTGAILGTPAYMPPEQARGDAADKRADVYALGAILYHLLAGLPPYAGHSSDTILQHIRSQPPAPVATKAANAPHDLVAIVARSMATNLDDRYSSANQLTEDLQRYQRGQLLRSQHYTSWQLTKRWMSKHRTGLSVGIAVVLLLGTTAGVSIQRIRRERAIAKRESAHAKAANNDLLLAQARSWLDRDPTAALAWLKHYPTSGGDFPSLRSIVVNAFDLGVAEDVLPLHDRRISEVEFAPDGSLVATSSVDGRVGLWAPDTDELSYIDADVTDSDRSIEFLGNGQELALLQENASIRIVSLRTGQSRVLPASSERRPYSIAVSPSGAKLAVSGSGGGIDVHSLDSLSEIQTLRESRTSITAVAFVSESRLVWINGDHELRLWSLRDASSKVIDTHPRAIIDMDVSDDGNRVATASADGRVRVWDTATSERVLTESTTTGSAFDVTFAPSSHRLAFVGADQRLVVVGLDAGRRHVFHGFPAEVFALKFSPSGNRLAAVDYAGTVHVVDLTSGEHRTLKGHNPPLYGIDFSPDGQHLATAGRHGVLRLWATPTPRSTVLTGHEQWIMDAVPLSNEQLLTCAFDGTIRLWNLRSRSAQIFSQGQERVIRVYPLSDRESFISWGNQTVRRWDISTGQDEVLLDPAGKTKPYAHVSQSGELLGWLPSIGAPHVYDFQAQDWNRLGERRIAEDLTHLRYTPDERFIVVATVSGKLYRWHALTGASKLLGDLGHQVRSLQFSNDSTHFVTGSTDGRVVYWSLSSDDNKLLHTHDAPVERVAISATHTTVLSGDEDGDLYKHTLGSPYASYLGSHDGSIRSIAAAPRRRLFATAGRDGLIKLWSPAGKVRTLHGHRQSVDFITFFPAGEQLASISSDRTIRIWNLAALTEAPREPRALSAWLSRMSSAQITVDSQAATALPQNTRLSTSTKEVN